MRNSNMLQSTKPHDHLKEKLQPRSLQWHGLNTKTAI